MTNQLTAGSVCTPDVNGKPCGIAVPLIDGQTLQQLFAGSKFEGFDDSGDHLPEVHTFGFPWAVGREPRQVPLSLLTVARKSMGEHLIKWSGFSALTLNSNGYPAHAIPLLTCCGDELCGYFACSMLYEDDQVVWREFGWVHPNWDTFKNETVSEKFSFAPHLPQIEFKFERDQYQAVLLEILRISEA